MMSSTRQSGALASSAARASSPSPATRTLWPSSSSEKTSSSRRSGSSSTTSTSAMPQMSAADGVVLSRGPSAAGDGGDDRDGLGVADRCAEAVQEADVLVVDEDVHEAAQRPGFVEQPLAEPRV